MKITRYYFRSYKTLLYTIVGFFLFFGVGFAQTCIEPLQLSGNQNGSLEDYYFNGSTVSDHFSKEFLLIEMVEDTCSNCISMAAYLNSNQDFIARTSGVSTCDYIVLTEQGRITQRVDKIGGPNTHVGSNSHQLIGQDFFNFPTNFGGNRLEAVPTFFIINRQGELVSTKIGALPSHFYDVCLPGLVCSDSDVGIGHDDGGEVGTGSCASGGSSSNQGEEGEDEGDTGDGDYGDGGGGDGGGGDGGGGDGGGGDGGGGDGGGGDGGGGDGGDGGGGDGGGGGGGGGDGGGGDGGDGGGGDGGGGDGGGGDGGGGDGGSDADAPREPGEIKRGRLQINIPFEMERDVITGLEMFNVEDSKDSYNNTVKLFTQWIWIGAGIVLLAMLIYAGFKILFSIGNAEKFKAALRILLYTGIGFAVAILSYVIINLVVNLF